MERDLAGRCALITGSTQGLGYVTAERLAAAGCNIVLNGFGDRAEIEADRRKLEDTHAIRAIHHGADLSDPGAIETLVAAGNEAFGAVDILVNNAVVRHFGPVESFKPADWDQALAVNLSACFHTIRLCLPGMRDRNFGRIVNMASAFALFGTVNRVAFVTTKTALLGLTRAVALETVGQNITCNAICPGSALTPAIDGRIQGMVAEGMSRAAAEAKVLAGQPAGRFVGLQNVAALIHFLCTPAGADVTGAALPIDAGWSAS